MSSSTGIISMASLIMCECSLRSSVSVGDAFRRNISTLKKTTILSNPARTFQRITQALTTDRPKCDNNQQKRKELREKNHPPEERTEYTQTHCPCLCDQEVCLG